MKIWLPVTAALLLLAGIWYAWASRDVPLDPVVSEWLVPPPDRSREPGNAYLYLVGILAGEGEDPVDTGMRLIGAGERGGDDQTYFRAEFREEDLPVPPLRVPDDPLLCVRGQRTCIERILGSGADVDRLLAHTETLLDRYQAFMRLRRYQTATGPLPRNVGPPYGALTAMNRLGHLAVIRALGIGEGDIAVRMLEEDVTRLRAVLPRIDDLMLKLTISLALAEDFRLIAELHARGLLHAAVSPGDPIFQPLTAAERSLESDMRRRLRDHADDVLHFRGRREGEGNTLDFYAWTRRLVFKPNRTLNEAFPRFYRNYRLSVLEPAEYLEELRKPFDDRVRIERDNYVGSVLNRKAVSNFEGYIGTFHDLDCFIRLVRIRLAIAPDVQLTDAGIERVGARIPLGNPYDGSRPFVSARGDELCFTSRRSAAGGGDLCVR